MSRVEPHDRREGSKAGGSERSLAGAAPRAEALRGSSRSTAEREPADPAGTVALAAQRFLEGLDATPAVPVPTALRQRIAAAWPLHAMTAKRCQGS